MPLNEHLAAQLRYIEGPKGGHGWVHHMHTACGHRHPVLSQAWHKVTCPACIRLAPEGTSFDPPAPKPKKARPVMVEVRPKMKTGEDRFGPWRLFNLRTGTFASDVSHMEYWPGILEKFARIRAADPRVRPLARLSLYVVQELDLVRQQRKQATYDRAHPSIAAKRGTTPTP